MKRLRGIVALAFLAGSFVANAAAQEARAWQQTGPYVAPDFEAYFPDDPAGGKELDRLYENNTLRSLGDDEYLAAVRRGLRHTTNHRTLILSGLGNRFIWGQDPQHPDAIELCYHAADFGERAQKYGTRHYAVYFGLSVVTKKTPAVLRTLADLCVEVDDPNDIGRVAWGAASQMDELLPYLEPHLASDDPYVARKAADVRRIFLGEIGAFEWSAQRRKEPPRPKPWKEMPEVRATLRAGKSAARLALLARIQAENLTADMNESYLADFAVAATDPDPEVREEVAITVGGAWVWSAGLHRVAPAATELMLELSHDDVEDVRRAAVYYGLSTWHGEDERVPRRMLELVRDPDTTRSRSRLIWGLQKHPETVSAILEADLRGEDGARARAAYDLWWKIFEEAPAVVPEGIAQPTDLRGKWNLTVEAPADRAGGPFDVVIARLDDGRLAFVAGDEEERLESPFEEFLSTTVGEVLHFDFQFEVEGTRVRVTGRLEDDRLRGTLRVPVMDALVVWSGERVPG